MSTDEYDRTYLRANREGYRVHRDYAAHYFRWSWAVARRGIGLAGKRVLDVGCGPDVPLLKVAGWKSQQPEFYVGVDLNKLPTLAPSEAKRAMLFGETDFTDPDFQATLATWTTGFDVIVSFESIEHMPVEAAWQTLWYSRQLVKPDGCMLLSTPVTDGHQAGNHIHEFGVDELRGYVEAAGWRVVDRFGTFVSARDVKPGMRKWSADNGVEPAAFEKLYEQLKRFHSDEVLSTFVAPVIPDAARNNLWKLEPIL